MGKQGTMMAKFTVAVNSRKRDAAGEWVDHADFLPCTAWGNRAESVARNGEKGRGVVVWGDLNVNRWDDDDGGKHERWEIRVDGVNYTTPRREAAPTTDSRDVTRPPQKPAAPQWDDDQIPF